MNIVQTCERTLMGWRQLLEWYNMGKWIQMAFSVFPRSLLDGNREILINRFFILKFWLSLWGRMRNCYLISRSLFRFLDLYKFRNCNFLCWVHFANNTILRSKLKQRRLKFKELGYEELGYEYEYRIRHWTKDYKRANEKGINEIGILILVFLDGILPLKMSRKIGLSLVESNNCWDKKLFG